jgi:two-component system, NarL family, response regulator DevR
VAENRIGILLIGHPDAEQDKLKSVVEGSNDLVVVGETRSVAQGVAEALRLRADITLIDLRLPDGSGVDACRQIRAEVPDSRVVILTPHTDEDTVYAAILAGSAGYILKGLNACRLHDALVIVARGGSLLDPMMTTTVLERLRRGETWHPADDRFSTLTSREDEILEMIGEGLINREIAHRLSLSEGTIKNYVSQVYAKLDVAHRSDASRLATERSIRREQV